MGHRDGPHTTAQAGEAPFHRPTQVPATLPSLGHEGRAQDGLGALRASRPQEGAGIQLTPAGITLRPCLNRLGGGG